jgi:very-short-patch-repair endonuclease
MEASTALARAAVRQQGLATRAQLEAAGLLRGGLRSALARGELVRVRRSVYAAASLPPLAVHLLSAGRPDPAYVVRVRAALLSLRPGAVAARRTAAVLWGFDLAVEPDAVEVDVPVERARTPMDGVVAVRTQVAAVLHAPLPGTAPLLVTDPMATVLACAVALPLAQAVAVADSALRCRRVTVAQLRRAAVTWSGQPGARRVRRVLALCDPQAGSVLESLLRVLLCEHGLAPARSQLVVRDAAGRFVARVDLAWPAARLLVEADGRRWHDPADARQADRRRSNALVGRGWRVLRFTWAEVVHDPVVRRRDRARGADDRPGRVTRRYTGAAPARRPRHTSPLASHLLCRRAAHSTTPRLPGGGGAPRGGAGV